MSSKTERQLKELRRLMPWTWDARVEQHPPGEKAIADFEKVLSYQDQPRTRKSTSATTKSGGGAATAGTPSTAAANHHGSASARRQQHAQQATPGQHASERRCSGGKRASLGQLSTADKAGREGKAARSEADPPPSTARHQAAEAAAATASERGSYMAAEEGPVEITPAAQRQRQASSPVLPTSATAAATPATAARTPGTGLLSSAPPLSVLASCPHNAALTSGHFQPTPATALPRSQTGAGADSGKGEGESCEALLIRRQLLQSTMKGPAASAAAAKGQGEGEGGFKSPEPRAVPAKHRSAAAAAAAAFSAAGATTAEQGGTAQGGGAAATAAEAAGNDSAAAEATATGAAVAADASAAVTEARPQGEGACSMEVDDPCPAGAQPPTSISIEEAAAAPATLPLPEALPGELQLPTAPASALEHPPLTLDLAAIVWPTGSAAAEDCPERSAPAAATGAAPAGPEGIAGLPGVGTEVDAAGAGGGLQEGLHLKLASLQTVTPCQEPLPQPPPLTTLQPLAAPLGAAAAAEAGYKTSPLLPAAPSLPEVLLLNPTGAGTVAGAEEAAAAVAGASLLQQLLTPCVPQPQPLSRAAPVGSRRPPRHPGGKASPDEQRPLPAARRASAPSSTTGQSQGGAGVPCQGDMLGVLSLLPAAAAAGCGSASRIAPSLPLFQSGSGKCQLALGRSLSDGALHSLLTALPNGPLLAPEAQAAAAACSAGNQGQEACPPLFKARGGLQSAAILEAGTGPEGEEQPRGNGDVDMAEAEAELPSAVAGHKAAAAAVYAAHHSKVAAAAAPVDKENHCGNALPTAAANAMAALPRPPRTSRPAADALPCDAGSPSEAAPPRRGSRQVVPAAMAPPRPLPAGQAACTAVSVAVAAGPARPVTPVLSTWKVQQLAAASQSHHARERQLLSALCSKAAPGATSPLEAAAAAAGEEAGVSPRHAPEVQHVKRGSAAAAGGGAHRRAGAASGRPGRACAGQGSGTRGQEIVMGRALARACTLLRRQRLSNFQVDSGAAPYVH